MLYLLRSGILSVDSTGEKLFRITNSFVGAKREIIPVCGGKIFQTDILDDGSNKRHSGEPLCRTYVMTDEAGNKVLSAKPVYSAGDDPEDNGWPICRAPRVDHALVSYKGNCYSLVMYNSQNYAMTEKNGKVVLSIIHKGSFGGWQLKNDCPFPPEILCTIFVFCRYLEQENEFIVV